MNTSSDTLENIVNFTQVAIIKNGLVPTQDNFKKPRVLKARISLIYFLFFGVMFFLLGFHQLFLKSVDAGSLVVDTLDDELNSDGDCSLREAITAANVNVSTDSCVAGSDTLTDTITFNVTGTIILSDPLPDILAAGELLINGGGSITVSGDNSVRVFYVKSGADLILQNITVSDGLVTCCGSIGELLNGGSMQNKGTVTIIRSSFENSQAEGSGGAIFNDAGTLNIFESNFSGNRSNYGGAVYGKNGVMNIDGSTFYNNGNLNFMSGYGGAVVSASTTEIKNSTFYSNTTVDMGGALWITLGSQVTIINSTFSENHAAGLYGQGGAIASDNASSVTIINSTLYNNTASVAGSALSKGTGTITVRNTIIANNLADDNCVGAITNGGHNIDSGTTCNFNSTNGSVSNTDPILGELTDHGGPTLTNALLEASPALNLADPAYCPTADQRFFDRRTGYCDIGAFEAQPAQVLATSGSGQVANINEPFSSTLQALVQDIYNNRLGGVTITFAGPVNGAGISNSGETVVTTDNGLVSFLPVANNIGGCSYIVKASAATVFAEYRLSNLFPDGWACKVFLPITVK